MSEEQQTQPEQTEPPPGFDEGAGEGEHDEGAPTVPTDEPPLKPPDA